MRKVGTGTAAAFAAGVAGTFRRGAKPPLVPVIKAGTAGRQPWMRREAHGEMTTGGAEGRLSSRSCHRDCKRRGHRPGSMASPLNPSKRPPLPSSRWAAIASPQSPPSQQGWKQQRLRMSTVDSSTGSLDQDRSDFGLWKEMDEKDEIEKVRLAAFLTEFAEMATARQRMVETPSVLDKEGLYLHDHLEPTSVRRLIEYLRKSRGLIAIKTLSNIVNQAHAMISACQNITFIPNPSEGQKITVVGDLHGDLDDLLMILDKVGMPSEDHTIVFNGDFVDRGQHGVEVLAVLLAMKVVFPNNVHLNRGNHEDSSICRAYGFYDEIMAKYRSVWLYELITTVFAALPLCTIISDRAFIVHGGIPRTEGTTIQHIGAIARKTHSQTFCTTAERGKAGSQTSRQVIEDMMWSDPDPYVRGQASRTSRGAGCRFGPDTAKKWLESLGSSTMKTLVRSHECVENGYDIIDCGDGYKVWTVFSASNYAGGWNQGAVLVFNHNLTEDPKVITYETSYDGGTLGKKGKQHKRLVKLLCKYQPYLEEKFETKADDKNRVTIQEWEDLMYHELGLKLKYSAFVTEEVFKSEDLELGLVDYKRFFDDCQVQNTAGHIQSEALNAIFKILDENGDGVISYDEFKSGCELLNHRLPNAEQFDAKKLFEILDKDHSGVVELQELNDVLQHQHYDPE